jgi:hypothetical protein
MAIVYEHSDGQSILYLFSCLFIPLTNLPRVLQFYSNTFKPFGHIQAALFLFALR